MAVLEAGPRRRPLQNKPDLGALAGSVAEIDRIGLRNRRTPGRALANGRAETGRSALQNRAIGERVLGGRGAGVGGGRAVTLVVAGYLKGQFVVAVARERPFRNQYLARKGRF